MKKLSLSVLVLSFVSLSALAQTEERGISGVNNGLPNRISMNVTVGKQVQPAPTATPKQTQGMSFGEKVNAGLHAAGNVVASGASMAEAPGQPIGGIVVKGGQNPTHGVTEDQRTYTGGRFSLTVDNTNEAARPGQPIGGIVVKGGQNPTHGVTEDHRTYTGGRKNEVADANVQAARPGNPIGGIVVKGGKN